MMQLRKQLNGKGNCILGSSPLCCKTYSALLLIYQPECGTVANLLLLHHINMKGKVNVILPHINDFIILNNSVYINRVVIFLLHTGGAFEMTYLTILSGPTLTCPDRRAYLCLEGLRRRL